MDDVRAVRIRVTGRVQGVSYRASCEHEARSLGLSGWVRNEPDGTVSAYAEGPPDAVASLVRWCRSGPPAARVAEVVTEDAEPEGRSADGPGRGDGFRTLG